MKTSRTRLLLVALGVLLLAVTTGCRAEGAPEPSPNNPSSTTLVEQPKEFDGEQVTFRGEAIGEAMRRGEMAWLHVNDDAYYVKNVEEGAQLGGYNTGMPVWLPADEAAKVTYFGEYRYEGDIVEVLGKFNSACAEHGGDMDIHARTLRVVEVGHEVTDPIHPEKLPWAIGLSLVAALLYWLGRRRDNPPAPRRR